MLRQAVFPIFPFLTSGSVQFVEYVLYVHSSLGLCCLETQQTNQQVWLCKVDKLSQASVYLWQWQMSGKWMSLNGGMIMWELCFGHMPLLHQSDRVISIMIGIDW